MATKTLGTLSTSSLTAIQYRGGADSSAADIAAIAEIILNENSQPQGQLAQTAPSAKPIWPGAFERMGLLFVPNRGFLKCLPGDWVGVDANGWPILVSANAIAGGAAPSASTSWSHT